MKGARRRIVALLGVASAAMAAGAAMAQTGYPIPGASQQAAQLISGFEGFRANPYNDAAHGGNCTIGYGTLLHMGPCTAADQAAYPNGITQQQALQRLQTDADTAANTVDRDVNVPLTAEQRDALTSFVYNVGAGAFAGSTLLRDLNAGNSQAAANELLRWHFQNGQSVQGLVNRRNAERCYFLQGATQCQTPLRDARGAGAGVGPWAITAGSRAVASRSGRAHLTIATPVRVGKTVRLTGRGWARGGVRIVAYVPGTSPYARITLRARAGHGGRFVLSWRVPKRIVDTLRWRLHATQGTRTATKTVRIRAA